MEIKRPCSAAEWLQTPEAVRAYIEMLEQSILQLSQSIDELKKRTEKLEQRVSRNSQNSNQPPSADEPFKKPERKKKKGKRKRGGQKGHAGHRQQLLDHTETVPLKPSICSCGSPVFDHVEPFYTHH
jgi:transposase